MLTLDPVRPIHAGLLYVLLEERTPEQSISHKDMPRWDEHNKFIASNPYAAWYLILKDKNAVGSIYLSKQREIGISIYGQHKSKGYGTDAVKKLMELHPGKFYANINPDNYASRMFFQEQFGAKLLQHTYVLSS